MLEGGGRCFVETDGGAALGKPTETDPVAIKLVLVLHAEMGVGRMLMRW